MRMLQHLIGVFAILLFTGAAHAEGMWRVEMPQGVDSDTNALKTLHIDMSTLEFSNSVPSDLQKRPQKYSRDINPFIVGGINAGANEFPEFGSIWLDGLDGNLYLFCGGTLLNDYQVLTAAHCLEGYSTYRYYFVPKTYRLSSITSANFEFAMSRRIHPNYNSYTLNNDIAILSLYSDLGSAYPKAKLIETEENLDEFDATAAGVGRLSTNGGIPNTLQKVDVNVIGNQECQSANGFSITDSMLCAGTPQGGKDSCFGDSGGPLFSQIQNQRVQIGIVSWGVDGCATRGRYGVYARVGELTSFIKNYVSNAQFVSLSTDDILDLIIPILAKQRSL